MDALHPEPLQHVGQLVVDRVHEDRAVGVRRQPYPAQLEGVGVTVEADQADGRVPLENRGAVPAQPEGRVHDHRTRAVEGWGEQRQGPLEEDGDVDRAHEIRPPGPR